MLFVQQFLFVVVSLLSFDPNTLVSIIGLVLDKVHTSNHLINRICFPPPRSNTTFAVNPCPFPPFPSLPCPCPPFLCHHPSLWLPPFLSHHPFLSLHLCPCQADEGERLDDVS